MADKTKDTVLADVDKREKQLTSSREAWQKTNIARRKTKFANAELASKDALKEMKKPKSARIGK